MNLTKNFTFEELIASDTAKAKGLSNRPTVAQADNLKILAEGLQRIRDVLGHPMIIKSGYRSPALNRAVGGAPNSAHLEGLAADFTCPNLGPPAKIVEKLSKHPEIKYDQMIYENVKGAQWIHVSFSKREPKLQVLTINDEGTFVGLVS